MGLGGQRGTVGNPQGNRRTKVGVGDGDWDKRTKKKSFEFPVRINLNRCLGISIRNDGRRKGWGKKGLCLPHDSFGSQDYTTYFMGR